MTGNQELQAILTEAQRLQTRANRIIAMRKEEKLQAIADRLKSTVDEMHHAQQSAAYVAFMESKAYVDNLRNQIKADGTTATSLTTGREATVQLSADRHTLKTFDNLKEGEVIEIKGTTFFIIGWDFNYAGSTATLLPATTKAHIGPANAKQTPHSGKDCHFDYANKKLTVSRRNALGTDDIVTIDDKKYTPVFTFLSSVSPGFVSYELAPLEEAQL